MHAKKYKNIYIVCVLTWSLLGVKKILGHAQSVFFSGLIENFRRASPPLSYADSLPEMGMGMPKIEVTIGIGDDAKIWIAEGMTELKNPTGNPHKKPVFVVGFFLDSLCN